MNVEISTDVILYSVAAIFGAGGFVQMVRSQLNKASLTDDSQCDVIAELSSRVQDIETKQSVQSTLINHIDTTVTDLRVTNKELARCISTLETAVVKLSTIVDLIIGNKG